MGLYDWRLARFTVTLEGQRERADMLAGVNRTRENALLCVV